MVRTGLLTRTRQVTEYSCGASALQAVLHYWGKDVDEQELMRIMGTNPEVGTFPENIARGARECGFEVEVRKDLTLDEVARFTAEVGPMIALCQVWRSDRARSRPEDDWDNGHYITVLGVDADFVYFQDPYLRMGKIFVTRRQFERHWHQIMGGAQTGNPALMHLGITVRGAQPAPPRPVPALDPAALDYARLGSFNMMVTHFDHVLLPFEFMDELRDLAADRAVRVEAFILVSKSAEGDISAMEGGNLEEERDAAAISVLLGVLAARAIGSAESARRTAEHTLEAVGAGDFGLSAEALRALAAKLEPGRSAVITLFENVWERRFREVARKYGGEVREQRLVSSATVAAAARELL